MSQVFLGGLSESEAQVFRARATRQAVARGALIFSEGDAADSFYIVESGCVSAFCKDGERTKPLNRLHAGDCFGEMAILNQDKRSASVVAAEDSTLLRMSKESFLALTQEHPDLARRINQYVSERYEELIVREQLLDTTGLNTSKLYVSIKGDPSLRETALFRERYESAVDRFLVQLMPNLREIILNRCAYQMMVNLNSGEVRTRSVFDPFQEEVHISERLADKAYVNRHFPALEFNAKLDFIRSLNAVIPRTPQFGGLPEYWRKIIHVAHENTAPLAREDIEQIISRLEEIRKIPNFYLRNININVVQDTIRMQFNCDGTHFVSSKGYTKFIQENFDAGAT